MNTNQPIRRAQVEVAEGMIDLGVGQPDLNLLPLEPLRQAAAHRFAQGDTYFLQYGPEEGDGYFNRAVAEFLTTEYGLTAQGKGVRPDQLFVTNGISQGLDLLCTLYTQPGDLIFVEEPTYFLVFSIFRDHGLRMRPIPLTPDGPDLNVLADALQEERPRFFYTIPSFQNPSSITASQANRDALVALSQEHDFWIVADEVYQMLYYGERPPRPFGDYVDEAPVLSFGSFSKILAPGLRLGWIQAAPAQVQRFVESGIVTSGGGLNPVATGIVQSALALGLQQDYLQAIRQELGNRVAAMDGALCQEMPTWVEYTKPGGGYFFWLQLPAGIDTQDLAKRAKAAQVDFRTGDKFSSVNGLRNCLRLCFAYYDAETLVEGVKRLGQVFAAL